MCYVHMLTPNPTTLIYIIIFISIPKHTELAYTFMQWHIQGPK